MRKRKLIATAAVAATVIGGLAAGGTALAESSSDDSIQAKAVAGPFSTYQQCNSVRQGYAKDYPYVSQCWLYADKAYFFNYGK